MFRKALWGVLVFFPLITNAQELGLPDGLSINTLKEPSLSMGITVDDNLNKVNYEDDAYSPFSFNGFLETRLGTRTQNQDYQRDTSIAELRLQTDIEYVGDSFVGKLVTDFVYDNVTEYTNQDFENGDGYINLREANLMFSPLDFMDVKVGRQVLTWGTGDLFFINDFFPKNWEAFFIGRDEEYLKSPSDAFKTSLFSSVLNIDVAYMPRHDESKHIDGSRISLYSPSLGRIQGKNDAVIDSDERNRWFEDDEIALRFYRNISSTEVAAYYFNGYWKTPEGQSSLTHNYIYPKLQVYGASVRSPIGPGVFNLEAGYYNNMEDSNGNDPNIRNSELRYLVGYEQELFKNFTAGFQYYVERMDDYDNYIRNLPVGSVIKNKTREVTSVRLTQSLMNQKLMLSLFNYYSPTDHDGYVRPKITYKPNDNFTFEVGGNVFFGKNNANTFFEQFEDNSNIFGAIKYNF